MPNPLDSLPLFATDKELALAIVGEERAAMWIKAVIPQLERRGFPRIDPLHDGRPVPLVKRFYDGYFGITAGFDVAAPDGKEDLSIWKRSKRTSLSIADEPPEGSLKAWRRDKAERDKHRPIHNLDTRERRVLRFMLTHPDCSTTDLIPEAGEKTMATLQKVGVVRAGDKDFSGQRQWFVTDEGRAEIKRIDKWSNWKF